MLSSIQNAQYGYYGTGLISLHDSFRDHQRSIVGKKRARKMPKKQQVPAKQPKTSKADKQHQKQLAAQQKQAARVAAAAAAALATAAARARKALARSQRAGDSTMAAYGGDAHGTLSMSSDGGGASAAGPVEGDAEAGMLGEGFGGPGGRPSPLQRGRKRSACLPKTPEQMAAMRRRLWQLMAKKELGKVQRMKVNNHKEALINYKRMATVCQKIGRQQAVQSQKAMRETVWRAKRLTREMQGYWKRFDRVERETRRRLEKEAEEQRKHDVELSEVKRQQRKLNFLITQTELYAHFMSRKLGNGSAEEQLRILNQLDEDGAGASVASMVVDEYDW